MCMLNSSLLEMCSVSTNGERVCPAQGFQLIGYHFLTIVDKHAHTFPEYQVLVRVSVHICIRITLSLHESDGKGLPG